MKREILLLTTVLALAATGAAAQSAPKSPLAQPAAGKAGQQPAATQSAQGDDDGFKFFRDLRQLADKKDTSEHPAGIALGHSKLGPVYVDQHGQTLYTLDVSVLFSVSSKPMDYCEYEGDCTKHWNSLAAPADAKPAGLWNVAEGPQGSQWTFRGLPVFTYADDKTPGSTAGQHYDNMFLAITYTPPTPTVRAPASIKAIFSDGAYILANRDGRALFTSKIADCGAPCAVPLVAGMANRNVGAWTVSRTGYPQQWEYRGKPVYVSQESDPAAVPDTGVALQP